MDIREIKKKMQEDYPGCKIIVQEEDGITNKVICDTDPTDLHPEWSKVVAVISSSEPHYHKITKEVYTVLEGTLTLHIDDDVVTLNKGESYEIPPNSIHWGEGANVWIECTMTPGWTPDDHFSV